MLNAQLACPRCGAVYPLSRRHDCSACAVPLEIRGEILFAAARADRRAPLARFAEHLAVGSTAEEATLGEGATPCTRAHLDRLWPGVELRLKLETKNPLGSADARGAAACAAFARQQGLRRLLTRDSTLAPSLAAYASRSGLSFATLLTVSELHAFAAGDPPPGAVLAVDTDTLELDEWIRSRDAPIDGLVVSRASPIWLEGLVTLALELAEQVAGGSGLAVSIPRRWTSEARSLRAGFERWAQSVPDRSHRPLILVQPLLAGHAACTAAEADVLEPIAPRDVEAARRLAADEEQLALGTAAAEVLAAALRIARRAGRRELPDRLIAILDGAPTPPERPTVVEGPFGLRQLSAALEQACADTSTYNSRVDIT